MQALLGLGKWLLREAVAALAPVLGGCAAALVGQAGNSAMGRAVGKSVEDVVEYFGEKIVDRWLDCLKDEPPEQQREALDELAAMPPEEVRQETQALLDQLDLQLSDADRQVALDYLTAIPQLLSRTLGRVQPAGPTQAADLLRLLPADLPPYAAPCNLPGTTYNLEALVGLGGFGTVYRATDTRMPYLPLAIKFRRDATADPVLRRERDNLERLLRADTTSWSPRLVRLCGYNLDHATPFLVYEWVPGGDLAALLASRSERPTPGEVLGWVRGIVEGLAFAHRHGIVHRDLKPANILMAADGVKLTDFGIGTVTATSLTATATLLRGAGTPLYMAPEQRRGAPADPRHDLYSVGVIWFQCLLGDTSADLAPGWDDLLREVGVPEAHIELIRRCVGPLAKRPLNAGELLAALDHPTLATNDAPLRLVELVTRLRQTHEEIARNATATWRENFFATLLGVGVWFCLNSLLAGGGTFLLESWGGHRAMHWMPLVGILALIVSVWVGIVAGRGSRRRALSARQAPLQNSLEMQVEVLEHDFPKAVAEWGGREALLRRDRVEMIALAVEVNTVPVVERERQSNWKPATPTVAPGRTDPSAAAATVLARELVRQYGDRVARVEEARPTPKGTVAATVVVGFYSFGITAGVLVAPAVVPVALFASTVTIAIAVPLISVAGAAMAGTSTFFVIRWFLNWQRNRRLEKPLRDLRDCVTLLEQAYPAEIAALGGTAALLDPKNTHRIRAQLELLANPVSRERT
jgi:serine/threonine protein kinase